MYFWKSSSSITDKISTWKRPWSLDSRIYNDLLELERRGYLAQSGLLEAAAKYGMPAHLELFKRCGCDIYSPELLAYSAVQYGNLPAMRFLIENGCPVEEYIGLKYLPRSRWDTSGWEWKQKLFTLPEISSLIQELVSHGASVGESGGVPLNTNINNPIAVQALLEAGADPNWTATYGLHALDCHSMYATFDVKHGVAGNEERLSNFTTILGLLHEHGASFNAPTLRDKSYYSHLDEVSSRGGFGSADILPYQKRVIEFCETLEPRDD